ncbi:hypothetical protein AYJ54_23945 [Bradyrhizobium centrolobii]|uniref:Uncharacterized protein n=1 Tax=Bradyrhizobium centrolobii TaxID=1505087 RepID=A0A176YG72_9BRAD|nr:hypothetical protein [Bradyrhizobium centrolobii]OAF04715.1 hypothetical protein AYJ54_23945 [Bradyrhizobium centrolobii]
MAFNFIGKVRSGLGRATNTVRMQAPLLRPYFPEISRCHLGTMNFVLEIAFQVRLPDIVTPPLAWHPSNPTGERFGITKIALTLANGEVHDAWIFTSEGSPHRFDDHLIEVVAERINGITIGDKCGLTVDRVVQSSAGVYVV